GKLNQVSGDELQGLMAAFCAKQFPAERAKQQRGENYRQGNPDGAPDRGIFGGDFVRFAIEDTKVNRQHYQDESTKSNPCKCRGRERVHLEIKDSIRIGTDKVTAP